MKTKRIKLHCYLERDGAFYSARCLELPVATFGSTIPQATKNLNDAIGGYLNRYEVAQASGRRVRKVKNYLYHFQLLKWYITLIIYRYRVERDSQEARDISTLCMAIG